MRLLLAPDVIEQFDALREEGATREETFERLVTAGTPRSR